MHMFDEQPVHNGAPLLQHARQNAIDGFASSVAHALHESQISETSQRSPVLPVGAHVPCEHSYPGAQFVATVCVVH